MFRGFGIVILAVSTAVSGASFVATANSPESGSFTSSNTPQPSQSSESETSAPTETLSQTQVVESSQADESAPIAYLIGGNQIVSGNVTVQSSETGTAYLVNVTVTVSELASITGAEDNLWNSVTITSAWANTNLSVSGLRSGDYKLYTVDAAGNLSAPTDTTVSIKPARTGTPDLDTASDLGTSSTDNNTADDTPTFSVSSLEVGTVVTLTATPASGSAVTCSFTATSTSGSCTFDSLPNGTYSVTAVQSGGGVNSDVSTALTNVVINKVSIPTPATPDLAASSDFGISNTDNITHDNTPTINVPGTFRGTAKVTATKSGSSPVTCTISSGACTLPWPSDGVWSVTVTDSDSSGNSATSAALSLTIDTVSPVMRVPREIRVDSNGKMVVVFQSSEPGTSFLWSFVQTGTPAGCFGCGPTPNMHTNPGQWDSVNAIRTYPGRSSPTYWKETPIPAANTPVEFFTDGLQNFNAGYGLYIFDVAGNYYTYASSYSDPFSTLVDVHNGLSQPSASSTSAPSGTKSFGQTLTNSVTFSGTPTPTTAIQWKRCTSTLDSSCSNIDGATSSSYTLTLADVGMRIRTEVTASNGVGSNLTTLSSDTSAVLAAPYAVTDVTSVSTVSGIQKYASATLSWTLGADNGATTANHQWSIDGTNWNNFAEGSVTGTSGTISQANQLNFGTSYTFRVRAVNSSNTASAIAVATTPITFVPGACNPTISADGKTYIFTTVGVCEWVVPDQIKSGLATFDIRGAQGGGSVPLKGSSVANGQNGGGLGGRIQGSINLSSLNSIFVFVGSKGLENTVKSRLGVNSGGFNGGGSGNGSTYTTYGGGGGATDVRTTPAPAVSGNDSRILVAGGGGGAGTTGNSGNTGRGGAGGSNQTSSYLAVGTGGQPGSYANDWTGGDGGATSNCGARYANGESSTRSPYGAAGAGGGYCGGTVGYGAREWPAPAGGGSSFASSTYVPTAPNHTGNAQCHNGAFIISATGFNASQVPPLDTTNCGGQDPNPVLSGTKLNGRVNLSWTFSNRATTSYAIEYSTNSNFSPVTSISNLGLDQESTTVTGLTNGTLHYFRMIATNEFGQTQSEVVELTPSLPSAPSTPTVTTPTSNTTPTVSLTSLTPGLNVTVTATSGGITSSCSFTATATNGSCQLSPALTPGSWSVTAKQTDSGVDSSNSSARTLVVDTTAPTASVTTATISVSGNASVQSSETGTAYLVNETVTVTNLASITGAADNLWNSVTITSANTNTSLSASGLSSGTYKVYTVDAAGNLSAPSSNSVTIPAPTASVTTATISVSGNASVQSSETGTAYLVNETVTVTNLASITGAADNLWNSVTITSANTNTSLSASGLSSGTYKVYTVDAAGNLSAPSTNTVSIKPARTGTPDLDAASDLGTSSTDNNTADDTPTFRVSSLEVGTVVTLTATPASGSAVTCSFTATSTSGSCTFDPLPNGTYSVTAVQSGGGVNSDVSTALTNVVINKTTVTPPQSAPDLAASSDFGISKTDNITNDNTPTINVTGTFTGTARVTATKSGSSSVTCTISSGACTLPVLSDGVWSVTVTDTDSSGNVSDPSESLSITIDTIRPIYSFVEFRVSNGRMVVVHQSSEPGTSFLYWGGDPYYVQGQTDTLADIRQNGDTTFWKEALVPVANTPVEMSTEGLTRTNGYYTSAVMDVAGNLSFRGQLVQPTDLRAPTATSTSAPTGTTQFGATLTNSITYSGLPTPTRSIQWKRCTSSSDANQCDDIAGATSSTYVVSGDDIGKYLRTVVTASNGVSPNRTDTSSATSIINATTPSVPTSVSAAITGATTATVSFTAPTSTGGVAITGYLVTSSPTGASCSIGSDATTYNCTGLTPDTAYTFTVRATNSVGSSASSVASSSQRTHSVLAVTSTNAAIPFSRLDYDSYEQFDLQGGGATSGVTVTSNGNPISRGTFQQGEVRFNDEHTYGSMTGDSIDFMMPTSPTRIDFPVGVMRAKFMVAGLASSPVVTVHYTDGGTGTVSLSPAGAGSPKDFTITSPTGKLIDYIEIAPTSSDRWHLDNLSYVGTLSATTNTSSRALTAGQPVTSFTPVSVSGGNSTRSFSISPALPDGLTMNTTTGEITGTVTTMRSSSTHTVTVSDGSTTQTAVFAISVNASLSASSGTLPSAVYKDLAVTPFSPITFNGGTSPITYAVSPGLPSGLTLNSSTGVISGTATVTSGSTTYSITATDSNGDTETSTFNLTVDGSPSLPGAPSIRSAVVTGQSTVSVSFSPPSNTGGAPITSYVVTAYLADGSAAGISASGTTSPITVTGLTPGTTYTFKVAAVNPAGTSPTSGGSSSVTTTAAPNANPSPRPTSAPNANPSPRPTAAPNANPSPRPTAAPNANPSPRPTAATTASPLSELPIRPGNQDRPSTLVQVPVRDLPSTLKPKVIDLTASDMPDPIAAPITPAQVNLDRQANSTVIQTRVSVAANPVTAASTLKTLSIDSSAAVRTSVAQNSNTDIETLQQLASDPDEAVSSAAQSQLASRGLTSSLTMTDQQAIDGASSGTRKRVTDSPSLVLVDNKAQPSRVVVSDNITNHVVIPGGGLINITATANQQPVPVDSRGRIQMVIGNDVVTEGNGMTPNTEFAVFMFSDPIPLGVGKTDKQGKFFASFVAEDEIPLGDHTLQVNGILADGQTASISLPVTVVQSLEDAIALSESNWYGDLSMLQLAFIWALLALLLIILLFVIFNRKRIMVAFKKKRQEDQTT